MIAHNKGQLGPSTIIQFFTPRANGDFSTCIRIDATIRTNELTMRTLVRYSTRVLPPNYHRIAIAPPLTAPYDGPYKVVARSGRVMKILVKGKVETVSLDRVKPADMECEPTTGTTTQRKTPSNSRKSTATRMSSRNPQGYP